MKTWGHCIAEQFLISILVLLAVRPALGLNGTTSVPCRNPVQIVSITDIPLGMDCQIDQAQEYPRFRSMCPFRWVMSKDPNRLPVLIDEARCCAAAETSYPSVDYGAYHCEADRNILGKKVVVHRKCNPVKTNRSVMRKMRCEDGRYVYKPVSEPIQIGCSCTYDRVVASRRRPQEVGPTPDV